MKKEIYLADRLVNFFVGSSGIRGRSSVYRSYMGCIERISGILFYDGGYCDRDGYYRKHLCDYL